MGWWSANIMGGDTPLDFEDGFYHIVGVEKFHTTTDNKIKKTKLTKNDITSEHIDTFIKEEIGTAEDEYFHIGYQVLGHILMDVGYPISNELKEKIIVACENDEWAKESIERYQAIFEFKNIVENYENVD